MIIQVLNDHTETISIDVVAGSATRRPATSGGSDDFRQRHRCGYRATASLTAHRTLALRDALANDPRTAFATVLYTLCLGAFYRMPSATCLEISVKSTSLPS